jgi:hypothetical protein
MMFVFIGTSEAILTEQQQGVTSKGWTLGMSFCILIFLILYISLVIFYT